MSGSEKGAVELLLEDVARQLEKAGVTDTGQVSPSLLDHTRLRQAVVYLLRAVTALAERTSDPGEDVVDVLQARIGTAIANLIGLKAYVTNETTQASLERIIGILQGEPS